MLVFYTDGVLEDRRKGLDDALAALVRVVSSHSPASGPDVLCEQILALNPAPRDDVAILVLHLDDRHFSPSEV
jgi:hypothetical protein